MVIVKCDEKIIRTLIWLAKYIFVLFFFAYENADPCDVAIYSGNDCCT